MTNEFCKVKINKFGVPFILSIKQLPFDEFAASCFVCEFDSSFYSDALAIQVLGIDIFNKLSKAVISRKAEFLAGRLLASTMMNALKIKSEIIDIGTNRVPIWPVNIKGSISHFDEVVICSICTDKRLKRIGIDIEGHSNNISEDLMEAIMNQAEKKLAHNHGIIERHAFSLFFSAKESLFKALYPEVNHYFDFDAAEIIKINTELQTFEISLNYDLSLIHQKGVSFNGKYLLSDEQVITLIVD